MGRRLGSPQSPTQCLPENGKNERCSNPAERGELVRPNQSKVPAEVVEAARRGWKLFPVVPKGKASMIKHWPRMACNDLTQLRHWAERFTGCNWGMATGEPSGVIVVDIDGLDGAAELSLLAGNGYVLPQTLTVKTGRGKHLYFRRPVGKAIRNSAGKLGKGLDVRGEGGYVLTAGSVHPNGKIYAYEDPSAEIAEAPEWLLNRLCEPSNLRVNEKTSFNDPIPEGTRNSTLTSLAGSMRNKGMSPLAMEVALLEENRQRCSPPLLDEEVRTIARSVAQYPAGRLPQLKTASPDWEEPEPFEEILPNVATCHLEWMPISLRPLIEDIADRLQVPLDFPAVAAIATLAGITNRRAVIQPKQRDFSWVVVPNLWGGIVASPGMLKSPVISSMTRPALAVERRWREVYQEEIKAYQSELELQEEDMKAWRNRYQAAIRKNMEKPAKPESTLSEPVLKRLITNDATFESLHEVLSGNPAGLFVLRDELTGWLAGLERQGREQERAFYLECWNGDSAFTIDRIGRGSVHVPHACISLFGGIQPARLRSYLADALRDGPSNDGLIQRFQLLVWPDVPTTWKYVDRSPDQDALKLTESVFDRIVALDSNSPLYFRFDEEALKLFEQWLTDLEHRIQIEESPHMHAHLAKYRSLMPALALLFALADGNGEFVPFVHAQMAREFCAYLESHARRVYASQVGPERAAAISLSQRIARGWRCQEGSFSLRDVYRNDWTNLDSPEKARNAIRILEEYRWVRQVENATSFGRPSERYEINPKLRKKV
ncbi:DUF3987 domain-containing protein [Occallatibacter savannae]|uniref:DUF3987 domain-containing protein n=1 Tax=Occallatibacter savannae TaxID=1002691 RepID=UPI0023B7E788|nr:DUF3987 domain-containing protein [Occallatibacter savannae]